MPLRKSRFIHMAPVGDGRVLVLHAVNQMRWVVDADLAQVIELFQVPQPLFEKSLGTALLNALLEREVLTELTPEAELAALSAELGATHGRDPAAVVEARRRAKRTGGEDYWTVTEAATVEGLATAGHRLDVLLFGDCDVQMEQDFLRQEGQRRGLDLQIAASFPDDIAMAVDRRHDLILIGALRARHALMDPVDPATGEPPTGLFLQSARHMIEQLRAVSSAPILIDNLPEPTVQPLGFAERGLLGHRNRFRLANVALAALAEDYADVHVVDVAAALAAAGQARLLDDGEVGFTHFGSPGWLLQRIEAEKAAVHGLPPDLTRLSEQLDGDPYLRERVLAATHLDAIQSVTRHEARKCVIVDLDGVLWPGVLAETGAPFAWSAEVSSPFSFIGLYFGLHEALLCLKRRGILLACVSKNDEATVRALWTYPDHYPKDRLLTLDDFVTYRINWTDKAENIRAIADELGFAPSAFLFIDDNPVERERIRQALPEIALLGEDLAGLRRHLLTDPRLQPPVVTADSLERTAMTRATLERGRSRDSFDDRDAFIASLGIVLDCRALASGDDTARVAELLQRTTQFTTTGRKFPSAELSRMLESGAASVFVARASDRFGDHGVVGALIVEGEEIVAFAVSCRALGMDIEHRFLAFVLQKMSARGVVLRGRIVETERNFPARNIYRDNGFVLQPDGVWSAG